MDKEAEKIAKAVECCRKLEKTHNNKVCLDCPYDYRKYNDGKTHCIRDIICYFTDKERQAVQVAISRFQQQFMAYLELSGKHPKTHCHFAHKFAGQEQQAPCFMLDIVCTVLGKGVEIMESIVEPSAQSGLPQINMHDTVNGDKIGLCEGIITIICDDATEGKTLRGKKLYPTAMSAPDNKPVTLNDCLKIIEFDGNGTVMVIFEEPLRGEIYEYGNYGNFWVKHGTTKGYA